MITADIDTNRCFLMMDELRDAMCSKGMDASNLVQDQTKLLSRTISNFIPPIKAKGEKGSARLNGEAAVEKDLCSLFSEAKPLTIDEVGSIHGIKNIDTFLTQKDGGRLHLQWDNLDPLAAHLPEEHNHYRGHYGTVKRLRSAGKGTWKARVVIPQGARAPYIRAVKARVGRGKCSMAMVAMTIGGTGSNFPNWIARHAGDMQSLSIVKINLENPAAPSITFGSRAPGITRFRERVQDAVNFRARVMKRRVKLILGDYKDWRKVRAKANARKGTISENPEVVE